MKKIIKVFSLFIALFALIFVSACDVNLEDVSVKDVTASIVEVEGVNLLHYEIELSNGEKITKEQTLDGLDNSFDVTVLDASVSVLEEGEEKFYQVTVSLNNGETFESKLPYTETSTTVELSVTNTTSSFTEVDGKTYHRVVITLSNGETITKDELVEEEESEEVTVVSTTSSFVEVDGKTYHRVVITLSNGETITKDELVDLTPYYESITVASTTSEVVEKDGKNYLAITLTLSNGETVVHYEELEEKEPEEELDTVTTLDEALANTLNYTFTVVNTEEGNSVESSGKGYAYDGFIRYDYSDSLGYTYADYIDGANGWYYSDYVGHYYKVALDSILLGSFSYADFYGLGRINPADFVNNSNGTYSATGDINAIGKKLFYDYDSEDGTDTFTDITIKIKDGKVYGIVAKSVYVMGDLTINSEVEVKFSGYGLVTELTAPESILLTEENYYDYFDEDGFEIDDSDDSDFALFIVEDYAEENGWVNATQYKEFVCDGVTISVSGGTNSGKYYSIDNTWRLYASEKAILTISSERLISVITIEYNSEKGGTLLYGYNTYRSGDEQEIEDYTAIFTLGSAGQARITSITVEFDDGGDEDPEYFEELYQGIPTTGNVNVLVIPVEFKDDTFTSAELENLEIAFNGTETQTGWQSLNTYYAKSSFGKLNLHADILDTYTLDITAASYQLLYEYYYAHYTTVNNPIDDIIDQYFASHNINLNDYDANHDGLVDGVYVVYSYKYEADDDSAFWAWTDISYSEVNYSNTEEELYIGYYVWMSVDFLSDPVIYDYRDFNNTYINCNAQTIIHETGHMLGLDDYYDFDTMVGPEGGLGGADMMDYNVGDHNAMSKIILGWITDETIQYASETNTYTIGSQSLTGDCIIITKDGTDSLDQEFVLIELYTLGEEVSGLFDGVEGLPSMNALRIYHIDGTKTTNYESTFPFEIFAYDNGGTSHKFIRILEADGDNSIQRSGFANDTDYYVEGSSLPSSFKWYDGTRANFTLTVNSINAEAKTSTVAITFAN